MYQLEKRLNELFQSLVGLYDQREHIDNSIIEHKSAIGELQLQIKTYNDKCKAVQMDGDEVFNITKKGSGVMNREDLYGDTDKLLFDILQELKKLNSGKETKIENSVVPSGVPCKYCNGTHENRYQIAGCASKHAKSKKKEGAK